MKGTQIAYNAGCLLCSGTADNPLGKTRKLCSCPCKHWECCREPAETGALGFPTLSSLEPLSLLSTCAATWCQSLRDQDRCAWAEGHWDHRLTGRAFTLLSKDCRDQLLATQTLPEAHEMLFCDWCSCGIGKNPFSSRAWLSYLICTTPR